MKLIEQNPFRMLGLPVNATARDLAANKSKFRLLDIGREVAFPTDLTTLLPPIARTKEAVAAAERSIALPHDKVRHALFWIAQPDTPLGKLAYEHLLQGQTDGAKEKLGRSPAWEACLCLATVCLQQGDYATALRQVDYVIEKHRDEFVHAVAGQTHTENAAQLRHDYLAMLTQEVEAGELYSHLTSGNVPEAMLAELRSLAVEAPQRAIEDALATAKAASDDAEAQLKAGQTLMSVTLKPLQQLGQLLQSDDIRYSRTADKLANAILKCSINYFKAIKRENRTVIGNTLRLTKYASRIAVGKIAKDHIKHILDILKEKESNLPPAAVEKEDAAIKACILKHIILGGQTIDNAIALMKACASHIVAIKELVEKDNTLRTYYLNISTLIVNTALSSLIEEYNTASEQISKSESSSEEKIQKMQQMLKNAWTAILMMDVFDKEESYANGRYTQNRSAIKDIIERIGGVICDNPSWEALEFDFDAHILSPYTNYWLQKTKPTYKTFYLANRIDSDIFDLRTEDEVWHDVSNYSPGLFNDKGNISSQYKYYMERYPNGIHFDEALLRYEEHRAKECYSISDCENYQKEFPNGKYLKEVIEKKEKFVYTNCYKSLEAYENYLRLYPQGKYEQEAHKKMQEIRAFHSCTTLDDYKNFLDTYNSTMFENEAKEKIDDLSFQSCSRKKDYKKYIEMFPKGKHVTEANAKLNEGCYIATMVYGSYEHPQVMVLRGFRDDVLQQHAWGRAFVRFYYRNSPTWVEHLKNNKPVNHIIRVILDGFIKLYKHEK